MRKPETMMIDEVKYVRADKVSQPASKVDGLEYAIVRSRDHGVIAGYIYSYKDREVTVINSRRVWYFKGCQTLEEFAKYGTTNISDCKIAPSVERTIMLEACGIIYANEVCRKQIEGAKEWKC